MGHISYHLVFRVGKQGVEVKEVAEVKAGVMEPVEEEVEGG